MSVIGISVALTRTELGNQARYVDAVLAAGGTPVLIPATHLPADQLDEVLERIDGLLLSGGGDVDPTRYDATPTDTLEQVIPARDSMEIAAFESMVDRGRRVLGICRGAQLMAVASGGSLVQDLLAAGFSSHKDESGGYATHSHRIKAEPGSAVEAMLDGLDEVNSHHHQAVQDPGTLLTPTAWAEDGTIEALEAPHLLALQWHPEVGASASAAHRRPFAWLVHGESRWLG